MDGEPYLSLVIPCYDEHDNVDVLLSRVDSALAALGRPFEVILVDDGSTDGRPRLLREGLAKPCMAWFHAPMGQTGVVNHALLFPPRAIDR